MDPSAELSAHIREIRKSGACLSVVEWEGHGERYCVAVRPETFCLFRGDGRAFHFDLQGRLRRAFFPAGSRGGIHYLRGFDGRLLEKRTRDASRDAGSRSGGFSQGPEKRQEVFTAAHDSVLKALDALRGPGPPPEGAIAAAGGQPRELLFRAADYDPGRLEDEARRFGEAYRPLGVLPPDCYRSLIVQATEGCTFNHCIFCSLYAGQRYRVKTPAEFRLHLRRVKEFLGEPLRHRKGVFLGEANALSIPQESLLEIIEVVRQEIPPSVMAWDPAPPGGKPPSGRAGGIASFLDVFTDCEKGTAEFSALREAGLRRVYLGIESGDEKLLRFLGKPSSNQEVVAAVESLKEAEIAVGAIVLLGPGGTRFREGHVEKTVNLLSRLPLDAADVIYLSPLVVERGSAYEQQAMGEGIEPLTPGALESQRQEFLRRLRPRRKEEGPQVAPYDVRTFLYY